MSATQGTQCFCEQIQKLKTGWHQGIWIIRINCFDAADWLRPQTLKFNI